MAELALTLPKATWRARVRRRRRKRPSPSRRIAQVIVATCLFLLLADLLDAASVIGVARLVRDVGGICIFWGEAVLGRPPRSLEWSMIFVALTTLPIWAVVLGAAVGA